MPPSSAAPLVLRDYQASVVSRIGEAFDAGHRRLTLAMPWGTGKTITVAALLRRSPWPRRIVVFEPTLRLVVQTAAVLRAARPDARFHAVCSSAAAEYCSPATGSHIHGTRTGVSGGLDAEDLSVAAAAADLDVVVTTDPDLLAAALGTDEVPHLVIATYASAGVVTEATRITSTRWNLAVYDEAHHTAGERGKPWALPLDDQALPADRRLFTTATVRLVAPADAEDPDDAGVGPVEVLSMDSLADYGVVHSPLSLRAAIDAGYLSDYRVATIAIREASALRLLADYHNTRNRHLDIADAAAQLALLRAAERDPHMRSVLVFHNRIATSRTWTAQLRALAKTTKINVRAFHVDGGSDSRHVTAALHALAAPGEDLVVVSNCKLFAEGVDIPALDAVLFAAPRTSAADIGQIIGRAVRPHPSGPGRRALIIVPVLHRPGDTASTEDRVARTGYLAAWQVLTVLAEEDEIFYRSLLQHRIAAECGPVDIADDDVRDRIRFDTSDLPAELHNLFVLRTVRRTTSGWIRVYYHYRRWAARGRGVHPRRSLRIPDPASPDGRYPLGARVASLRAAVATGRVPDRIVHLFDSDPLLTGWRDDPGKARTRRSVDQWLNLVETHLASTGAATIEPWHASTDPATGARVEVGQWVARLSTRTLTPAQRHRLTTLLPHQFPPDKS
ncbi:DEAD/DEAH box helicase family protein [Nocardia asiatica]|uniref:DEAD/DEAH box helicase family protein n=1 Tax=Nocardia asiatica TaxID=209252 RepID=UPI0002F57B4F|nr:DEAD/DEAH box helicase family protein [Nocardia asiatica]